MTSVGYNVTIHQGRKIFIESNLFGFNQEAYDQPVVIKWYKYTRGEIKFTNLADLHEQMMKDKQEIETYFAQQK